VSSDELLTELRGLLVQGNEVSERLLARLEMTPDPIEIVSLLESLALSDERRAHVLDQLRRDASQLRKREEERSIRQFVLRALERIGVPQTTGFLEDYLYATELVEAKSRGMGALRRDEYRAWHTLRDRGRPRVAYIVPCLDEDGRPVPRWMSRSDWPLARRFVVESAEELWQARRVRALVDGYRHSDTEAEALFTPLVSKYAREVLGEDAVPDLVEPNMSTEPIAAAARRVEKRLEPHVVAAQERVAAKFAYAEEAQRFWGMHR
jgi:hypothetical protein